MFKILIDVYQIRQRNEELEAEVASLRQQLVGTNAEAEGRHARLGRERGDLAAQVSRVRRIRCS